MRDDDRRRKGLTPMSGELKAGSDWATPEPIPEARRPRKEKTLPVTRGRVLIAGLKRIAVVLAILLTLISVVYGSFGVALIVVGAVLDAYL